MAALSRRICHPVRVAFAVKHLIGQISDFLTHSAGGDSIKMICGATMIDKTDVLLSE